MRLLWTEHAAAELEEILVYLSEFSARAARRVERRIVARTLQLEAFPQSGPRVLDEPGEDIRETFTGQYRIVYRLTSDNVEILAVRHGRRDRRFPAREQA